MDKETEIRVRLREIFRARFEHYKKFSPGDFFHFRCGFCSIHCRVVGQIHWIGGPGADQKEEKYFSNYLRLLSETGWTPSAILDVLEKGDVPEDIGLFNIYLRFFIYDSLLCPYTDARESFTYPVRLDPKTFGELHRLLDDEGEEGVP